MARIQIVINRLNKAIKDGQRGMQPAYRTVNISLSDAQGIERLLMEHSELERVTCGVCNDRWGERSDQCPQCCGKGYVYTD